MRERLRDVYARLLAVHGPQGWWPGDTPFEIVVGAILTQNTAWVNVEKAIANLRSAQVLDPIALSCLPVDEIARLVRPSGYFNVKARRLRAFVEFLAREHGGDLGSLLAMETAPLREALLSVRGIGPETADAILLYAAGRAVFVVDAYTRRVFSRLGLVPSAIKYPDLQALFADHLPPDVTLFNEYHALVVRHGKEHCRKRAPRCRVCPLHEGCVHGHRREGGFRNA